MKRRTTLAMASAVATAAAGALVAGTASAQETMPAMPAKPGYRFEKCYGIVKAGKNDCQTATNSCAGQSKKDLQADAWVYVPAGVCDRIVGGSTEPKKT